MKRTWMIKLLGSIVIIAILSQTQCTWIAGKAAMSVGKEVYNKVKEDDSNNDK